MLMRRFPVDAQPFVEKKYSGWNGVLQVWICTKWNPGGSFLQWLNRCASGFEKNHEGVFLEFTPVQAETMREMNTSGLRLPDLILFSPGVISNPDVLMNIQTVDALRSELKNYGQGKALPVALGGYIWVYNTALCDGVPRTAGTLSLPLLPEDADGQSYSAALLGLLSETEISGENEYSLPDTGIDLGLPASASGESLYSADVLDMFIDGELPCIPVNANDIARLNRLRESGKGPDWQAATSGEIACTDQLLLAAIPEQPDTSGRSALVQEFMAFLLQPDAQAALADVGAFSVTGETIHAGFSIHAEMDALLNNRPLWLPNCFSEYSAANAEAIVRRFLNGEISAKNALRLLGFEGM